jgi:hypothetical protein
MNFAWNLIARTRTWVAVGRQVPSQAAVPYTVASKIVVGTPLVNGSVLLGFRLAY